MTKYHGLFKQELEEAKRIIKYEKDDFDFKKLKKVMSVMLADFY